jgi:hypothetical protein
MERPPPTIPLASAPPALSSAAALAAALTERALPPFFQHMACLELQPAVDALLALKGGDDDGAQRQQRQQQQQQLDVMDNVLSPFLLLAAAERM